VVKTKTTALTSKKIDHRGREEEAHAFVCFNGCENRLGENVSIAREKRGKRRALTPLHVWGI